MPGLPRDASNVAPSRQARTEAKTAPVHFSLPAVFPPGQARRKTLSRNRAWLFRAGSHAVSVRPVVYNGTMATNHTGARYVQPYRYRSPNIPLSVIRRFARQIGERFQPDKVVLFGSYAYGTPHNESDVDLLVIMPANDVVAQAIRISGAFERQVSHSIIVRTARQVQRGLKQNNWFLREVMAKGKVLYDARNSSMGPARRRGLAISAILASEPPRGG